MTAPRSSRSSENYARAYGADMGHGGPMPDASCWSRGPLGPLGRATRIAVFATGSFALAEGGHRVAGGSVAPHTTWLALAGLIVLGVLVSGRERSGLFIGSTVLTSQLASHALFVAPSLVALMRHRSGQLSTATLELLLLCHHGTHPVSAATLHQAARGLNLTDVARSATGASANTIHLSTVLASAVPMLAAHLCVAAALAWWLRRGERLVWAAAREVVATVVRLVGWISTAVAAPRVASLPTEVTLVRVAQRALPVSRRGPPGFSRTVSCAF